MTDRHLDDVAWLMNELARLRLEAERQAEELEDFIIGRRVSNYPLGRVFLTNIGRELDEIVRQLELRLSPHR